jgi:enoyl-CoA hydratase/carnithine racemase
MIHVSERDGVRWLRMESGKVQALDLELVTDLRQSLEVARADDGRPVVLTGTGTSFSAGVDLFRVVRGGEPYVATFLPALTDLLLELFSYPGPLVTAINGHAVAGGALIAWCGDLRIMSEGNGRIGVPELRVGVPFPTVAVEILRFTTAGRGLQPLAYIGRTLPAKDAEAAGLVDEVVSPGGLEERSGALARTLASVPRDTFVLTKRALRAPALDTLARTAASADAEVLAAWQRPSTLEAIRAYLEQTFGTR